MVACDLMLQCKTTYHLRTEMQSVRIGLLLNKHNDITVYLDWYGRSPSYGSMSLYNCIRAIWIIVEKTLEEWAGTAYDDYGFANDITSQLTGRGGYGGGGYWSRSNWINSSDRYYSFEEKGTISSIQGLPKYIMILLFLLIGGLAVHFRLKDG